MTTRFESTLATILKNLIIEDDIPQFPPSPAYHPQPTAKQPRERRSRVFEQPEPSEKHIAIPDGLVEFRKMLSQIGADSIFRRRGKYSGPIRTWRERHPDERGQQGDKGWWRTDYAEIIMRIIVGAGLENIPIENRNDYRPLYGINRMFINLNGINHSAQYSYHRKLGEYLFMIMVEYGHAFLEKYHGSRFNYWLQKDTQGNDISIEEATQNIVNERIKSREWAIQQLTPYTVIQTPRGLYSPPPSLKYLTKENFKTIEDVEAYFIKKGNDFFN